MAISNRERVGQGLDSLRKGLAPFVNREMTNNIGAEWYKDATKNRSEDSSQSPDSFLDLDVAAFINTIWHNWDEVFRKILGFAERNLIAEVRTVRNNWAHQKPFSTDDTYRAIDSIERLLLAISAPHIDEVSKQKQELLRIKFEEQARYEKRKVTSQTIETGAKSGLKGWREVMTPHDDVATGRYQQAEFAVDLWQVKSGSGAPEYLDPKEFFRRTFVTKGLEKILETAIQRIVENKGDPVVELATNFGGGKTHSMLALYHLFSGIDTSSMPGLETVLKSVEFANFPKKVSRAVLVGTRLSPGQPIEKEDGTLVNTLWGELAWQLGGKEGYKIVEKADKTGTNPGDALQKLFDQFSPCLILIDEWVAYARQLYEQEGLPGGSFDTHFTFAQSLSECAKTSKNTFLVVSIPQSAVEIGGDGGSAALKRLQQAIGRLESTWNPATSDESFEIVRRRLFKEIKDPDLYRLRDAVINEFYQQYKEGKGEFPDECADPEYKRRIEAAYPIHPSLFDSLYNDWSTLDKFQRTRGVLRLMSAVIHRLWEQGDKSLMIMPSSIPLEDIIVRPELTRYLDDDQPWSPIIDSDIDGENAISRKLDREKPNLGRYSACRRLARCIFMRTAPHNHSSNRGISTQQVKLGCVQPGENAGPFSDALRYLSNSSNHLYQDDAVFWYSLQPNVQRIAKDYAAEFESYQVTENIVKLLRKKEIQGTSSLSKVYVAPSGPNEVPDEQICRLVILPPESTYSKPHENSAAIKDANLILENRGGGARLYRNTLLFLAADDKRMAELVGSVRLLMAWEKIQSESESERLNLDNYQRKMASDKLKEATQTSISQVKDAFIWGLVPEQGENGELAWETVRVQGSEPIVSRLSKKLEQEEFYLNALAPSRLRMELDKWIWRNNEPHVSIKKLWECFCQYSYLPRLRDQSVLIEAIGQGVSHLIWEENFAFAEMYDEQKVKYSNLSAGKLVKVSMTSEAVLVRPDVAQPILKAAGEARNTTASLDGLKQVSNGSFSGSSGSSGFRVASKSLTFWADKKLDPTSAVRDTGKIMEEIVSHLASQTDAEIEVIIQIKAGLPEGVDDDIKRIVQENSVSLKLDTFEFQEN